MRTIRGTSPIPDNIDTIMNTISPNSKLMMYDNNVYETQKLPMGIGNKLLLSGLGIGLGYGAFKLGQHKDAVMKRLNKFGTSFKNMISRTRSNLTRSHT